MSDHPYKKSNADRRDIRASKDSPETPRANRSKKDRKRWCGGHEGREHIPAVKERGDHNVPFISDGYVRFCSVCGKDLETYYGHWFMNNKQYGKDMPDWLKEYLEKKNGDH